MKTRAEHLQWCKDRALEYCDSDPATALSSMFSDLGKHPDTAGHAGIMIGMQLMVMGSLSTPERAREFINGFN